MAESAPATKTDTLEQQAAAGETPGWKLDGRAKEAHVESMFDGIATPYDRLNRLISLGRDGSWRRRAVTLSGAAPGDLVVDLGTGTGDLALSFLERVAPNGGRVVGVDLSAGMLAVANAKRKADPGLPYRIVRAGADRSGLAGGQAAVVSMGWVLRNVGDRAACYAEIQRLLRPGGRFVCLDMSHPQGVIPRIGCALYRHLAMPVLAKIAGGPLDAYRYLAHSTDRFPPPAELAEELTAAGFEEVHRESLMLGSLAIHVGTKPRT